MNGDEQSQLSKIYEKVVTMEEAMEWIKRNVEIQVGWCQRNEDRIRELEICRGHTKGVFATVGAITIAAVSIIVAFICKSIWK